MNNVICGEDERIDDLQRNGYRIIQKKKGFCFGMDAVLLSGFAQVKDGEVAVDLGTGTGIIPILLEAKTKGKHFTGLEIQKEVAEMAERSVRLNHLDRERMILPIRRIPRYWNMGENIIFGWESFLMKKALLTRCPRIIRIIT